MVEKQSNQSTIKILDTSPAISSRKPHTALVDTYYTNATYNPKPKPCQQNPSPKSIQEMRKEKLKQIALQSKDNSSGQDVVVKNAPVKAFARASRNDKLIASAQIASKKVEPIKPTVPSYNFPVADIIESINNNRLSQVLEKPTIGFPRGNKNPNEKQPPITFKSAMLKKGSVLDSKKKDEERRVSFDLGNRSSESCPDSSVPVPSTQVAPRHHDPGPPPLFVGTNNNIVVLRPDGPVNR